MFSGILNNRLYIETNGILVDEQNGFRKHRACIDHIYVLSSVIRARLQENKSCFVDFKKAFDWVNRDLLKYKLLSIGITCIIPSELCTRLQWPVCRLMT